MRLLTPRGRGGVAVVAATGEAERARLVAVLRDRRGGAVASAPGAPPRLVLLQLDGDVRDEALLVDRRDGALELHLHGSPALVERLAAAFGPFEAPVLPPAERLLRAALSPAQLQLALEQRDLDFDAPLAAMAALPQAARRRAFDAALERSRAALALAVPCRVALVGAQNAGKSTLFNCLLLRERALTGPLPGLTRDAVVETTTLAGYPYELVDTPGEGDVHGVDADALRRGRLAQQGALRVLVVDRSRAPGDAERRAWTPETPVIASKCDLAAAPWPAWLPVDAAVCAADAATAPRVRTAVGELLRRRRSLPPAGPAGGVAALDDAQWQRLAAAASRAGVDVHAAGRDAGRQDGRPA